ncbi:MAG: hypothetical protein ETSY1_34645 [Candidatus Entotheonella factor]|uniref:Uncharacterized protein n=1 Tax=Entotheonella factor TaxID=1429438 RepID=W4LAZ3_ENTF1|nr:hypothetical protein [Candidatus Entotheonella palauensis]ETW94486.1 MAG: hypothetical protein ETSY1_34645 [Candidatus Entotheonella factor]
MKKFLPYVFATVFVVGFVSIASLSLAQTDKLENEEINELYDEYNECCDEYVQNESSVNEYNSEMSAIGEEASEENQSNGGTALSTAQLFDIFRQKGKDINSSCPSHMQ